MGKILLNNIAEELASKSDLTRDAADNFMRAFVATIEKGLQEDSIVKVKGLGTFKLLEVSDRDSVDVNTGERITIKGHRKVTFTPDTCQYCKLDIVSQGWSCLHADCQLSVSD